MAAERGCDLIDTPGGGGIGPVCRELDAKARYVSRLGGNAALTTVSDPALIDLLRSVPDTHEIVISRAVEGDGLLAAWRAAAAEERDAYARWSDRPSRLTHAAYLAATDQADAAVATLEAAGISWASALPLPA